ncbi:MAG: RluA family pseudouridine synthase [Clostridiales bacterium]|nr:RluA family pseudouridine synthase [Clostridiales bacterium]
MSRRLEFIIGEDFDGKKVVQFLRGHLKMSARLTASLKRVDRGICLNGEHARTIDIMKRGDVLSVLIPDEEHNVIPSGEMPAIIYEDNDLLVVNKPALLPMHPSHSYPEGTLANAVAAYLKSKGRSGSFRAVGRLDKGTSGVVICALNRFAAAALSGKVEKEYICVAQGIFEGSGTIDRPIYRPDPMKTLRAVGDKPNAVPAITHWQAIAAGKGHSVLRIKLETGRTHQIRVHFASLGSPLAGDDMYGGSREYISRPALHCEKAALFHPVTKESMTFFTPLPSDMEKLIEFIAQK